MTEGTTPRDPRGEPSREPVGGPEAPVNQPPPSYPPADTPPPPPPGGGTWTPPPGGSAPPQGGPGWGGQPGGYPPQPGGSSGLAENVASGLCYLATWVTGLIFYFIDQRPEVRFHAVQAIGFGIATVVVYIVVAVIAAAARAGFLLTLVWLAFLVIWIVLMVQAFQGKHFKLPVIGDFAEQQASKPRL